MLALCLMLLGTYYTLPIMLALCLMLLSTKLCWHNWPEPTNSAIGGEFLKFLNQPVFGLTAGLPACLP